MSAIFCGTRCHPVLAAVPLLIFKEPRACWSALTARSPSGENKKARFLTDTGPLGVRDLEGTLRRVPLPVVWNLHSSVWAWLSAKWTAQNNSVHGIGPDERQGGARQHRPNWGCCVLRWRLSVS